MALLTVVAAIALALSACDAAGITDGASGVDPADERLPVSSEPLSEDLPTTPVYTCHGVETTADELAGAASLDDAHDHPGAAELVRHTEAIAPPSDWSVVERGEDRLAVLHELAEPDVTVGTVRTHYRLVVELIDPGAPPDIEDPLDGMPEGDGAREDDPREWQVTAEGPCPLQQELDGIGSAALHLDPDALPDPESSTLALLVVEHACASGEPATSRVRVVDVGGDDDTLRLTIGVEPREGGQTCPSNPATPVTLEFDEPVGDRSIVDQTRLPPREVEPWDGDVPRAD